MFYVFLYTASAKAYGQKPKFVMAEHSATAEGEHCAYGPTLRRTKFSYCCCMSEENQMVSILHLPCDQSRFSTPKVSNNQIVKISKDLAHCSQDEINENVTTQLSHAHTYLFINMILEFSLQVLKIDVCVIFCIWHKVHFYQNFCQKIKRCKMSF